MAFEFTSHARHPTDKAVTYTFPPGNETACLKAETSINDTCLMLDGSDAIIAGGHRAITFYLVKHEEVTLERVEGGIKHRCTCSEHRRRAPCGDVLRQLHEIIKYHVPAPAHVHIQVINEFINVSVDGQYFEAVMHACQSVDQIKAQINRHNLSTQKFTTALDDVRHESIKILLALSNRSFTIPREVSGIDGMGSISPRKAHELLDTQATKLANEVEWYFSHLDFIHGSAGMYIDAIDRAIDVYLLMMKQVLQRIGPDNLRYEAAKAYYDDPDDGSRRSNFWARIGRFFQIIRDRGDHLEVFSADAEVVAEKLDELRHFGHPMNGGHEDRAVSNAIYAWMGIFG